jgi:hypothetical protein
MPEKVKTHIWLMGIGTALSAFSFLSIMEFTDPYSAGAITVSLFFVSLFLACLGFFSLLGIGLRQRLQHGLYAAHVAVSFRQALFIALFVTLSLILRINGLLFWWVEIGLMLFLVAVEIFLNL